jgi:hypothetical protein
VSQADERYENAVNAAGERLRALAEAVVLAPEMPGDASLRALAQLMVQAVRWELDGRLRQDGARDEFWHGYYEACRTLDLERMSPPGRKLIRAHQRMAQRKLRERGIKMPPTTERRAS